MKNEFTVTLGTKTLTLYSLTYRSDIRVAETPTLDTGLIRRITGSRKNFYTLRGRTPYAGFLSFCTFINSLVGTSVSFTVGSSTKTLMLSKGECTACEEGMCEYIIELEEVSL